MLIVLQGSGATADLKIADFGLSALVRLDEDGYDAGESSKRKNFRGLKDVNCLFILYVSLCCTPLCERTFNNDFCC